MPTAAREAERVARQEAAIDKLRRPAYVPPDRPVVKVRDGLLEREFVVVFDGR